MKRRLLIIAICLLLGAVVNVAVAWGCAVFSPVDYSRTSALSPLTAISTKYGYRWTEHRGTHEIRVGWPTLCLQATCDADPPSRFRPAIQVLRSGSGGWDWEARYLPLQPNPLLFLANTSSYAVILWLLIPGPFVLRRFLRVRRGLCPTCRYPIGKSSVCTECGCGLPKRAVAS